MRKIVIITLAVLFAVATGVMVWANVSVCRWSQERCYSNVEDIPAHRVAILLGTTKYTRYDTENPYFKHRVAAAAELYHSGKAKKILVSGDNSRHSYNEPADMRSALLALGVPKSDIVLDYAGFRTYDSMVRAQQVFGQDSLIVISQHWHNERALYIAKNIGMEAVGFDAADVSGQPITLKLRIREWLARTKMALDLLFHRKPHFLGDPITI